MSKTVNNLNVLVSGGGIAGNAVALQLLRAGAAVTVVERATAPRPGGQAVDLRGPSREVAEKMGLMPGIRTYLLHERGMSFVNRAGHEYVRVPMEDFGGKGIIADIEITRGDLNQVLLDEIAKVGGNLDYRYGEWIVALSQDQNGVDVTFNTGANARFDLVIGADGVHSATRRLAFGPEEDFVTYLGGYASFFTIPTPAETEPGWFAMLSHPGASVGIRSDFDPSTSKAIITLRTDKDPTLRRDVAAQQRLISELLGNAGWLAPKVLQEMPAAADFYFDELDRVDMPSLANGRVVLVGDAGYCGSPLTGMGTAMALVGAYVLAGEIATNPSDPTAALARHDELLRPFIAKAKELPGGGLKIMLPKTEFGMRMTRLSQRIMFSRLMRPLTMKMFTKTDDYTLPQYPATVIA